MGNKGGAPTKYGPNMVKRAKNYLDNHADLGNRLPYIEGLAFYLDIHRDTIYSWKKDEDKKEFSDIIEKLMAKQAMLLIEGGLLGDLNPTITKLMLNKHGYSEKIENKTDITSNGEKITGIERVIFKEEGKA